jgi:hypothetical protein
VVLPFDPNVNSTVEAIRAEAGTVIVGGIFGTVGGAARPGLAAIDAVTGVATAWAPNLDVSVLTLHRAGSMLYVGGGFTHVISLPYSGIAGLAAPVVDAPGAPPAGAIEFALAPSPATASTRAYFRLPSSGAVRLRVFDARGRQVAEPWSGRLEAGPHALGWDLAGRGGRVPAGVYFLRLEHAQAGITRKLVVLE